MNSSLNADFRKLLEALPPAVQARARKQFALWLQDHRHPSLHFKRVGAYWSARIDRDYRVLGVMSEGTIVWFYIGPHDGYERQI